VNLSLLGYMLGAGLLALAACAPQRPYRPQVPQRSEPPARVPSSAPLPPPEPLPSTESFRRPVPEEPTIREQSLKPPPLPPVLSLPPMLPPAGEAAPRQSEYGKVPETPAAPTPLPDDSSLLAKITPGVTPQRAASLRLTDEASKLLEAGETAKAINRLERTIAIDSTNPYGYFYLAKAQFRLGRHRESLNFLDVAEPRLRGEPFWLAEVHALRGENFRALGQLQRAEESYSEALRLNSGNRTAADALARLRVETPAASR
jgi:predicted negative regulator of RcsB-dependent stress response